MPKPIRSQTIERGDPEIQQTSLDDLAKDSTWTWQRRLLMSAADRCSISGTTCGEGREFRLQQGQVSMP